MAHQLVQDTYSLLVVDMTSFITSIFGDKKSLFKKLQNYTNEVGPMEINYEDMVEPTFIGPYPYTEEEIAKLKRDSKQRQMQEAKAAVKASMEKVFGVGVKKVSVKDLEKLRESKEPIIEELKKYRDHLAHRFEALEVSKAKKGVTEVVNIDRLVVIFHSIKDLFNDIRFISSRSTLAYTSVEDPNLLELSEDLLSLVGLV